MTVAAIILCPTVEGALADTAGRPAVRRVVESAWAGGATPIVVVAPDDGQVAGALTGSAAILAEPAPLEGGPRGQIVRGLGVAIDRVGETDAAIVWPGRMAWVDAETVTSLIEAHGLDRRALLRPTYHRQLGWPALLPLELEASLRAADAQLMPDELVDWLIGAGAELRQVETGDPGVIHDHSTSIEQLPEFEGPSEPVGGAAPEWGSAAADDSDEGPLAGPALAPYRQAADEGD